MKPTGPIPHGFSEIDGELAIGGNKTSDIVARSGGSTPLFVYSKTMIAQRMANLRAAICSVFA